jgi:hypothetical protein
MKKPLIISLLAVGAIVTSFIGTSRAAGEITNSDIATGAVNSRTIKDYGIYNRDIYTGAVNSRTLRDGGILYRDLNAGTLRALQSAPLRSGTTVRGVVGGDFEGFAATPGGPCENNCDWGTDMSLPFPAPVGLTDADVLVDTSLCGTDCPGITAASSEANSATTCTGTVAAPTAPAGKVCIYVAGAANAVNVVGYSVIPGSSGASKYGFKLAWVSTTADDTFIDAVWAYRAP